MEKDYQLKKLLDGLCEEQVKISVARRNWATIRKSIKIILLMPLLGEKQVHQMILRSRQNKLRIKKEKEEKERMKNKQENEQENFGSQQDWAQRLIIAPNNSLFFIWCNLMTLVFVVYMLLLPMFISYR